MGVTVQNSTQYGNGLAVPPVMNSVSDEGGRVRVLAFNFAQSGAGDVNSYVNLCKLPAGRIRVLRYVLKCSAFGAARVLDVGVGAYINASKTTVAEAIEAIAKDLDVSAVALKEAAVADLVIDSRQGALVRGKIAGDTIPDGATLDGYILYVND